MVVCFLQIWSRRCSTRLFGLWLAYSSSPAVQLDQRTKCATFCHMTVQMSNGTTSASLGRGVLAKLQRKHAFEFLDPFPTIAHGTPAGIPAVGLLRTAFAVAGPLGGHSSVLLITSAKWGQGSLTRLLFICMDKFRAYRLLGSRLTV